MRASSTWNLDAGWSIIDISIIFVLCVCLLEVIPSCALSAVQGTPIQASWLVVSTLR